MTELDPLDHLRRIDPASDLTTLEPPALLGRAEAPGRAEAAERSRRPWRARNLVGAAAAVVALMVAVAALAIGGGGSPAVAVPAVVPLGRAVPAADRLDALADALDAVPTETSDETVMYTHSVWWNDQTTVSGDETTSEVLTSAGETWLADGIYTDSRGPGPEVRDGVYQVPADLAPVEMSDPISAPPDPERYIESVPDEPAEAAASLLQPDAHGALDALGEILVANPLPVHERADLLRALATIDGIELRGDVTDRAGRPALALAARDDSGALEELVILLDPEDGHLLGRDDVLLEPSPAIDREVPAVLSYQVILDQQLVAAVGDRPSR